MNPEQFKQLTQDEISGLSLLLQSLWYDWNGNWDKAHQIVQNMAGKDAARIHAYLHRKEGDHWNAGYWYRRAGEPFYEGSLDEEWEQLVSRFLK